jgi:hypothetical protein
MLRPKTALNALLVTAAIAAPLGLAAPADATYSRGGCTVTPLAPEFHNQWTTGGDKRIQYKVNITCNAGLSIRVTQERYDADTTSADDLIGSTVLTNDFTSASGVTTVTRTVTATLPDADAWGDDNEEMYQRVHFTVTSSTVTSAVTPWDYSSTRSFHL